MAMTRPVTRPVISDLQRTSVDVGLEVLALLVLVVLLGMAGFNYMRLPDRIPSHFGFNGKPDAFGGRENLLIMPAVAVFLYTLLTVLAMFPHVFNYPFPITEENARMQYSNARQMISALKVEMLVTFAYISWASIGTAMGTRDGLNPWFPMFELPVLAGIIGFYMYRAKRAA